MNPRLRNLLFLATMLAAFVMTALPASATFAGKNGRIVFIHDGEVFTMNPDGTDIKQLTQLGPDNSADFPAWSADGKQIVFNESPPPDGVPQLWIMNADGSNQHLLLAERDYSENRPSFSPDGTTVVFGRCKLFVLDGDTCAIYTIGIHGENLKAVTEFRDDQTARSPMYSPDGKTIAFIYSPDTVAGFGGVIYLVDADGSNEHRITETDPCLIRPDWSPDGKKLTAFAHFCNPQNETIAVMNADGNGLRYLTENGTDYFNGSHDRNPAFSPDGTLIVFERNAPDFSSSAIYLVKTHGGGLRAIAAFPRRKPSTRKSNRKKPTTEIEEGGAIPRWGVAQE